MPLSSTSTSAARPASRRPRGRLAAAGAVTAGAVVLGAAGYAVAAPPAPGEDPATTAASTSTTTAPGTTTASTSRSVVPLPGGATTSSSVVPLPGAAGSTTAEPAEEVDGLVGSLSALAAQQATTDDPAEVASLSTQASAAVRAAGDAAGALADAGILASAQEEALTCVLDVVGTQLVAVFSGTYRAGAAAAGLQDCLDDVDPADADIRGQIQGLLAALQLIDPTTAPSTPPAPTTTTRTPSTTTSAPSQPTTTTRPPTTTTTSAPQPGATTVVPARGTFTSGYGSRWGSFHYGIDIANSIGTPIVATQAGRVINAGPATGFGLWVRVQHADGTITTYGHNDRNLVSVGQTVAVGQQIATIGNRGDSTGPHLHFEVTLPGGTRVDPQAWLAARGVRVG